MKSRKKYIKKSKGMIALIIAGSILLTSLFSYYIAIFSVKKTEETSENKQYEDIRSLLNSSNDAANEGNYDNALAYMQKAIDLNASIPDLYMKRADIYITISQYQKAIDDFTKALDLNKDLTQIYALRGHLYYQMESYDQALNDYDYALKYAPGDIDILNMRINIYLKDQKYEQALKDINQLIEVDPDNATYRKMGGETCFLMGDYENAIVFYTDAIEKLIDTTGQTDGELLYNRGLSLLQVGKFEDGESDFTKAIGLDYSADESYFQRGLCRYAQHNYSGAIEDFKNYEATYSDNKEDDFVYYLADSYYKSEQPALAVPYFQKCIENNIMPGTCNYYLAGIALDAENYEASIDYYTKAIEQKSQIIPSTLNRAIAYLHIDDTNAAIKDLQAVIDDGSNEELIDKAISVLNQINN